MANKANKDNKNLIIGICAAVVVVIIIIVAVILATRNSGGLDDSYFVSDNTKYVLTYDSEDMAIEDDEEYVPVKTHFVYTYNEDEVTGLKAYYVFANDKDAKAAFNYYNENMGDEFAEIELDGKYVILTANASEYEDMTPSDIKQQIEFMEMLKEIDTEDDTEYEEEVVVEEDAEEK